MSSPSIPSLQLPLSQIIKGSTMKIFSRKKNSITIDAAEYGIGNYAVEALDNQGCILSSTTFVVTILVSVAEESTLEVKIYPNSFSCQITLKSLITITTIRIMNIWPIIFFIKSDNNNQK